MNYECFFENETENYRSLNEALFLLSEEKAFIPEVKGCITETINIIIKEWQSQHTAKEIEAKDNKIIDLTLGCKSNQDIIKWQDKEIAGLKEKVESLKGILIKSIEYIKSDNDNEWQKELVELILPNI